MNLLHWSEEVTWDNQLITRAGHTPHNFKPDTGSEFSRPPPPEPQLGCKQLFNQTHFKCVAVRQCYKSIKRNKCTRYQNAAILFFIHISTPDFGIQNITRHVMCGGEAKRNGKWVDVGSNHPSSHTLPIYNSWASNRNLSRFYCDEVKGWYDRGNGSHLFACKNNINQLTNFMTQLLP